MEDSAMRDDPDAASIPPSNRAKAEEIRPQAQAARVRSEALRAQTMAVKARTREIAHRYALLLEAWQREPTRDHQPLEWISYTEQLRDAVTEYAALLRKQSTPPERSLKLVKAAAEEVTKFDRQDAARVADNLVQWFCNGYYASSA